jgi:ADP-ribose pyrophosphatase
MVEGGLMTVMRDQVRLPSGREGWREYVLHPGAVLIVPILPNGNLLFERQFRYPLRQAFIELPAGKIDPGEDVLTTGQRELLEETGFEATNWVKLGLQHPCIGYSNEVIHMYLATDLQAKAHQRDEDEAMDLLELSLGQALQMVFDGQITDGKTIVALIFAQKYLGSHG